MNHDDDSVARMRTALELTDAMLLMMREHLRRKNPDATELELQALVNTWLAEKHRDEFVEPGFRVREQRTVG